MSAYHTKEAFDARQAARRADPRPPEPLKVFYHVSCMNHWQVVVTEQLRLFAFAGLTEVTACVIGSQADAEWCVAQAKRIGVLLTVVFNSEDLGLYEGPTLNVLYAWCVQNPQGSVLYLHTKGVSAPGDSHKMHWRRLMQKFVVSHWRDNLNALAEHDMIGVGWQEDRSFPHFSGNFWCARADWIAHLQHPQEYRKRHPGMTWAWHSWDKRMYVETWIGSEQWHHVFSHCGYNGRYWEGDSVFKTDLSIEGFRYVDESFDYTDLKNLYVEIGGGTHTKYSDYFNVDQKAADGWGFRVKLEELYPCGSARLPFGDDSVVNLFSSHCIEHVRNLHGVLHECVRVCVVGAVVELRVPHWVNPMALCHDHKQVIPPEQVVHWCETAIDYWWKGSKKRLRHRSTESIPSGDFDEARRLFPHMNDQQVMKYIPGACHELRMKFEVIAHEG